MKHHCHCGFEKHCQHFKTKRLGALGAVLMMLHLFYHVAECLIVPAVFMAIHHHNTDTALAISNEDQISASSAVVGSRLATFQSLPESLNSYNISVLANCSPKL